MIAGRRGNVEELVAIDAAAERAGLRLGITLAQARAMHPDLKAVADGMLSPYERNVSGWLEYAGGLGGILGDAN